jgi:hypothetical protein
MKRDLDLIRKILKACEDHEHGHAPRIEIGGFTDEQVGFHVYLAGQAALMIVADTTADGDESPQAIATSLTWDGYEFLEASRDDGTWAKAKQAAGSAGGMALDVVKSILIAIAIEAAKKKAGLK